MNLHEELFQTLIADLKKNGQSLDRVIADDRFKALPLSDKVDLLVANGHTIRQGSHMDRKFWKDLALGAAGTALMVHEPLIEFSKAFQGTMAESFHKHEVIAARGRYEVEKPVIPEYSIPKLKDFAISVFGAGIAAPALSAAIKSNRNMRMVKSLLHAEPGSNTHSDAINVLSRS